MRHLLRLYVIAETPNSTRAMANLKRICEEKLQGKYEIEVIDIRKAPQLAEDDKIIATPTVIKRLPLPIRRVVGDLSNYEKVLLGLDLVPQGNDAQISDQQAAPPKPQEVLQQ